jgi:hypothetical protein
MDIVGAALVLALGASLAVCLDEVFAFTPAIAAFLKSLRS